MIPRYTRPEMGRIFSDQNRFDQWLAVELAASEALAESGEVPARRRASAARARRLRRRPHSRDRARSEARRHRLHHRRGRKDGRGRRSRRLALAALRPHLQRRRRYRAGAGAEAGLRADPRKAPQSLAASLKRRAFEFKDTVQIGRTHGIHAEPITFGLKLALWYDEMQRGIARFQAAAEDLRVGKISGAVGTFGHIGPEAEEKICARLGLKPAAIASQVISRDRHAAWVSALALLAATLEKIALEVRHLQRTEVREAEEPFSEGQKGSSAMPHKRNPVVSEQICGLARVVRANVQAAFENIALWHERDISHSSVERVILADSAILTDYLLAKTLWLVDGMRVYPERMLRQSGADQGPDLLRASSAGSGGRRECCARRPTGWCRPCHAGLGDRRRFPGGRAIATRKSFLICRLKRLMRPFPWTGTWPTWIGSSPEFSSKFLRTNDLELCYQGSTKSPR